jgi:vancomycin permeability regulator SanA
MAREMTIVVGRSLALFVGLFSLLNLAGDLAKPGFDANVWWIDLRPLSAGAGRIVLAMSGVLLTVFGIRRNPGRIFRTTALFVTGGLSIAAIWNVAHFYLLMARGAVHRGFPLPFSFFVCLALAWIMAALVATSRSTSAITSCKWRGAAMVVTWLVCLVGMPLAQMVCFGRTDYRRPADAVVVFGAKAFASGNPSPPLEERVRTACDLYHAGLAPLVIFSGGPGAGEVHETEAMRRLALQLGVPGEAMILDRHGVNTQATVANTVQICERLQFRKVLAVSHFYHLPRVKLAYRRAGREVFTVPAQSRYWLRGLPQYLLREVAAQWAYYVQPLGSVAGDPPRSKWNAAPLQNGRIVTLWAMRDNGDDSFELSLPFGVLIVWTDEERALYVFNQRLKSYFSTTHFDEFLDELNVIPDETPVQRIETCTVPRAYRMPVEFQQRVETLMQRKKLVWDVPDTLCYCESNGLRYLPVDK